ncbi:MAG: YitT family protein [Candidatus Promineifilaceae bacterium]
MVHFSDKEYRRKFRPVWPGRRKLASETRRALLLAVGVALAAFGFAVFQVPYNLAAGGVGGISLIINNFTDWSVGLLYLLLNIPLLAFGFKHLGRWPFVARTAVAVVLFAALTDLFGLMMPRILDPFPPAEDMLLSAVYGGILGGIGGGLVYRSGSTIGGTGILGRWLQFRTGQPLSQIYIYTDGAILLAMGLVFGWAVTLYGLLMLFINGLASDYILEGPSRTRVVTIVTNHPNKMAEALMATLGRGASYWEVTGGYSGQRHYLISCTVSRPQVAEVKRLVAEVDPESFLTIAVGHQALGGGFDPLRKAN